MSKCSKDKNWETTVLISSILQSTGSSLQNLLHSIQKEQEDVVAASASEFSSTQAAETVNRQISSAHTASSNLMSENFFSADRKESKYIKAGRAGREAVAKQANRQMAILNAGLAELNALSAKDGGNYAIRNLIGQKTARRMQEERQQTVREESERNLEEIKENIEQKAQEAVIPKDENGNPVENCLPAESIGEVAPMPEISGSAPVSVPEIAAAPVPETATLTPAPAVPSIDIRV
jgi:hypothetical protein